MTNTRLDIVGEIVRGRSRGYSKNDTDSLVNAGLFDSSDRYPAGGILSTPVDLVRFVDALLEGRILYGQSMKEMWSSSTITSNEKTGHGLGWDISADGKEIFQGGSTVGATSFLFVQPDKHLVIAIAVNLSLWSRNRHELAQKLAEICTLNQRDH
jgi:CubicO group peptidase (beta-lactamase class C family)